MFGKPFAAYSPKTIAAASMIAFIFLAGSNLNAQVFSFKYVAGTSYRVLSEVDQDVYVNGVLDHNGDQLNRVSVKIEKVDGDKAYHTVEYLNSLEARHPNEVYQYDSDRFYTSEFWRDTTGKYTIDNKYFVPTVRDVPVFPKTELKPGDTWSYAGAEVQDLRDLGIPDAFIYTMPVSYQYKGKSAFEGKDYDLFLINYNIFYKQTKKWPDLPFYPILTTGYSHQRMFWDREQGRPYYYDEEYVIVLTMSDGKSVSFEGTARARVLDDKVVDSAKAVQQIQQKVDELKIPNVTVREDEKGITIALENIQFAPDSALLLPGEKEKLDRLAEILNQYKDKDLLISGHTALAGTEKARQELSEDRARVVGQYLLDKKVRSRDQIMFQGLGAREPIADNDTEAGKSRNRRVEITILN